MATYSASTFAQVASYAAQAGAVINVAPGTYQMTGIANVAAGVSIIGSVDSSGNPTTIFTANAGGNWGGPYLNIQVNSSQANPIRISNINLQGAAKIVMVTPCSWVYLSNVIQSNANSGAMGAYIMYQAGSGKMDNIHFDHCIATTPYGFGFYTVGEGGGSMGSNITYTDCKAIGCGSKVTTATNAEMLQWSVGFDVCDAGAQVSNVTLTRCIANGCLESGFYQEFAPGQSNVQYIDCVAGGNGVKPANFDNGPSGWGPGPLMANGFCFFECYVPDTILIRCSDGGVPNKGPNGFLNHVKVVADSDGVCRMDMYVWQGPAGAGANGKWDSGVGGQPTANSDLIFNNYSSATAMASNGNCSGALSYHKYYKIPAISMNTGKAYPGYTGTLSITQNNNPPPTVTYATALALKINGSSATNQTLSPTNTPNSFVVTANLTANVNGAWVPVVNGNVSVALTTPLASPTGSKVQTWVNFPTDANGNATFDLSAELAEASATVEGYGAWSITASYAGQTVAGSSPGLNAAEANLNGFMGLSI